MSRVRANVRPHGWLAHTYGVLGESRVCGQMAMTPVFRV